MRFRGFNLLLLPAILLQAGCAAGLMSALSAALGASQAGVIGAAGAAQNFDYQKLKEVLPRYDGLEHQTVAVVVEAPLDLQYLKPDLLDQIAGGLMARLSEHVPGISLMHPLHVRDWQFTTPQWNALAFSEIASELNVDRVVLVDVQEFRLHPRGNRWLWEGVCRASIGIIERDGYDPDSYADAWEVSAKFPDIDGLDRDSASEWEVQTGLLAEFVKQSSWLFYTHLEPKHPDRYNPSMDPDLNL
ncbi:MAG: hypothetical protein GY894_03710 [Planctomycetes bacterium]|jgi:hypothetical protein|nr:hypothetical protein [Planctomycetota bacterium]MCP4838455.1 hypothetical protein [Planctomycetota bacterium]